MENLEALTSRDEVKFVLSSRADYEFASDFTQQHNLAERVNAVLFSPAFRKDATGARDSSHCLLDPQELAEWMLADNVPPDWACNCISSFGTRRSRESRGFRL